MNGLLLAASECDSTAEVQVTSSDELSSVSGTTEVEVESELTSDALSVSMVAVSAVLTVVPSSSLSLLCVERQQSMLRKACLKPVQQINRNDQN